MAWAWTSSFLPCADAGAGDFFVAHWGEVPAVLAWAFPRSGRFFTAR